jgi:hypothetical protein
VGGPQNLPEGRGEEKNYFLYRDSNSDPSAVQLVSSRYTDLAIGFKFSGNFPYLLNQKEIGCDTKKFLLL